MVTTALAIAAATWGIAMAASPIFQIRRIVRRRSSRDISIAYFNVLLVGFALWIAYGIAIANIVLVVPNTIALCVCAATILVAARYRR